MHILQMNEPVTYEVEGALDIPALERAANLLLDRHELLRCAFKVVDGQIALEYQPEASIVVTLVKVGNRPCRCMGRHTHYYYYYYRL